MKYASHIILFVLSLTIVLTGCKVGKYLPANERLYAGTDIEMVPVEGVSSADRKALKEELAGLARPKPNSKIFGFPYRVWLYYIIGEPKKDSSFRANLRRKLGQEPVFATTRSLTANANVWKAFLQNEGYFHSEVEGRMQEEGYKARGVFQVKVHRRYTLDSVTFLVDTLKLGKDFKAAEKTTLLKPPVPYRLDNIKLERERISQELKRKGYYYFNPDYVAVLADTARQDYTAKLYLAIKPEMPEAAGTQYYIRNVYIYPNYTLATAVQDTNRRLALRTESGFQVVDSSNSYDDRLFRSVIGFKPGRRYNSRIQDITLSRLVNLGTFKFVRNRFEPATKGDTSVLDVHYYLTPFPKKSIRAELAGTSKSNNYTGTQLTLSWRNRNFLRRAESLVINLRGGIETQVGGGNVSGNNYLYGVNATLTFPRLVSPIRIDYDRRQVLPKTNLTVGYETIVRSKLYNLNSISGTFGYSFRGNTQVEHTIQPFGVTYVKPSNFGDRFFELLTDPNISPTYLALIQNDQFILNSLYSLHFNSAPQNIVNYSQQLIFNIEPAGNLAGLLFKKQNAKGEKTLFNQPYAQYLRTDVDSRHYYKLTPSVTWASRVFAGVGIPYGNSENLPLIKQYFVGGSNSVRAFRPRAVGPGRYTRAGSENQVLLQDGGGDVKLEASTEFRIKFNKFLQGAVFVDAGNVWTYKSKTLYDSTAVMSKDFLKEMAVGGGIGLRIDVTYFVLRFDLATPFRKPWLPENERWVFNQINFRDTDWRKQNLLLNIAVGYPF